TESARPIPRTQPGAILSQFPGKLSFCNKLIISELKGNPLFFRHQWSVHDVSAWAGGVPSRSAERATVTVAMRRKSVDSKPYQSSNNRPSASESMEHPPQLAVQLLGGHAHIL